MITTLPTIRFNKYKLREINQYDYIDLYNVGSNSNMCKYLNWGPYKRLIEAKIAIERFYLRRPLYGLPIGYAITVCDTLIGVIDFHTYNESLNSCEIGFFLKEEYQNQGIMTKALKKVIDVGFNHLKLDKLICGHIDLNEASKRVILKCGFKYEFEKIENIKDKDYICKYYSIYKGEYYDN